MEKTASQRLDERQNDFLRMIGGTPIPRPMQVSEPADNADHAFTSQDNDNGEFDIGQYKSEPKDDSIEDTQDTINVGTWSQAPLVVSSPAAAGVRAPPPTPATRVLNTDTLPNLPLIKEESTSPTELDGTSVLHRLAEESDLRLKDSKFANKRRPAPLANNAYSFAPVKGPTYDKFASSPSHDKLTDQEAPLNLTPTQIRVMARISARDGPDSMEAKILAKFRAQTEQRLNDARQKENSPPKQGVCEATINLRVDDVKPVKHSDTVPFPAFEDPESEKVIDAVNKAKLTSPKKFSPKAEEFVPTTPPSAISEFAPGHTLAPQMKAEEEAILDAAKAQLANKVASLGNNSPGGGSPTIVVTCSTDSDADVDEPDEDRENLKYFSSYGTPAARDKPRSRTRKVVLTGLPVGSDLTLLQSLISGGAIDTMSISPLGSTAYVTFTTGDACDSFYDKYPNGITFKHKGKTHTVFVDKAKDVDVISGMLQGALACGASRCVRAVGADEDWGMGALYKLAYGKSNGKARKVENIQDTFRSNIRTIIFRFASIGDAIQFKSVLLRDEDWEACNIQFMDDPCEKATAVHLE